MPSIPFKFHSANSMKTSERNEQERNNEREKNTMLKKAILRKEATQACKEHAS